MDELTKRRVALMQRYSAIPFEKVMFLNKLREQIKNSKNNDKTTNR